MKKQTLEEVALSFLPNSEVEHDTDFIIGFEFGAKWQQEQAQAMEKEKHQETWETAHQAGRFEGKGIAEDNWQTFEPYWEETFKSE